MEYRKFDDKIIARIDKGEEILEQVKNIALKENIKLANINALGAVGEFTVGVFKTGEKKYYANEFKGDFEIVSLTGTINTMNGELVSATCEMIIYVINGEVDRYKDEDIGLNLFKF